ncbi:MAG: hypothetical protein M5R40_19895 [Anaerolineae bacterium]|nr:hypothetical protein [Anaerolineae bacterium]
MSRREMLKMMAAGSAAVAATPLAAALGETPAKSALKPAAQEVAEIVYWQAPIWRLGKDVKPFWVPALMNGFWMPSRASRPTTPTSRSTWN